MLKQKDEPTPAADEGTTRQQTSISSVLKDKTIWLIAFNVFFVYAVYCGLTFFIPFLKNIYMLPVAWLAPTALLTSTV